MAPPPADAALRAFVHEYLRQHCPAAARTFHSAAAPPPLPDVGAPPGAPPFLDTWFGVFWDVWAARADAAAAPPPHRAPAPPPHHFASAAPPPQHPAWRPPRNHNPAVGRTIPPPVHPGQDPALQQMLLAGRTPYPPQRGFAPMASPALPPPPPPPPPPHPFAAQRHGAPTRAYMQPPPALMPAPGGRDDQFPGGALETLPGPQPLPPAGLSLSNSQGCSQTQSQSQSQTQSQSQSVSQATSRRRASRGKQRRAAPPAEAGAAGAAVRTPGARRAGVAGRAANGEDVAADTQSPTTGAVGTTKRPRTKKPSSASTAAAAGSVAASPPGASPTPSSSVAPGPSDTRSEASVRTAPKPVRKSRGRAKISGIAKSGSRARGKKASQASSALVRAGSVASSGDVASTASRPRLDVTESPDGGGCAPRMLPGAFGGQGAPPDPGSSGVIDVSGGPSGTVTGTALAPQQGFGPGAAGTLSGVRNVPPGAQGPGVMGSMHGMMNMRGPPGLHPGVGQGTLQKSSSLDRIRRGGTGRHPDTRCPHPGPGIEYAGGHGDSNAPRTDPRLGELGPGMGGMQTKIPTDPRSGRHGTQKASPGSNDTAKSGGSLDHVRGDQTMSVAIGAPPSGKGNGSHPTAGVPNFHSPSQDSGADIRGAHGPFAPSTTSQTEAPPQVMSKKRHAPGSSARWDIAKDEAQTHSMTAGPNGRHLVAGIPDGGPSNISMKRPRLGPWALQGRGSSGEGNGGQSTDRTMVQSQQLVGSEQSKLTPGSSQTGDEEPPPRDAMVLRMTGSGMVVMHDNRVVMWPKGQCIPMPNNPAVASLYGGDNNPSGALGGMEASLITRTGASSHDRHPGKDGIGELSTSPKQAEGKHTGEQRNSASERKHPINGPTGVGADAPVFTDGKPVCPESDTTRSGSASARSNASGSGAKARAARKRKISRANPPTSGQGVPSPPGTAVNGAEKNGSVGTRKARNRRPVGQAATASDQPRNVSSGPGTKQSVSNPAAVGGRISQPFSIASAAVKGGQGSDRAAAVSTPFGSQSRAVEGIARSEFERVAAGGKPGQDIGSVPNNGTPMSGCENDSNDVDAMSRAAGLVTEHNPDASREKSGDRLEQAASLHVREEFAEAEVEDGPHGKTVAPEASEKLARPSPESCTGAVHVDINGDTFGSYAGDDIQELEFLDENRDSTLGGFADMHNMSRLGLAPTFDDDARDLDPGFELGGIPQSDGTPDV